VEIPDWVTMPCYRGPSLASVLPATVERLGIQLPQVGGEERDVIGSQAAASAARVGPTRIDAGGEDSEAVDSAAANRTSAIAETRAAEPPRGIVLVLADGLGEANLAARAGHAPFLAAGPRQELVTGFPSTTVASLASLGTGLEPGRTGLAGYCLRDPATGRRANLIKWDTPTAPEVWQPHATVFERLDAIGRPASFVGERRFADSAMTRSSLRGARFYPARNSPAAIVETALAAARRGDGLIYVYWGQLDKTGHASGWESTAWGTALEELDQAVRQIQARLPRGWELWLTADHGMVDVAGAPVWDVAADPELASGVRLVAGEPRAVHLYTGAVNGANAGTSANAANAANAADAARVAERWRRRLGDQAWVLTKAEAVAAGLFGRVDPRVEPYLGDVIVALAGRATVRDSRLPGAAGKMVGQHGSLTAVEMRVPLIRWAAG
jgi:hypothetical protein